jgi:2-methylcitrate dehydratase PrpD
MNNGDHAVVNGNGTSNGTHTNGTSKYSSKPGLDNSLPATTILSEFIASADTSQLTSSMRSKLTELILDYIGITAAAAHSAASTPPIVSAITSLSRPSTDDHSTVFTKGANHPPHIASLLNATFAHSLDFDDTHAPSTLHPGVTAISAALACAESLPNPPPTPLFLLAVAVGYEITCRLGRELFYSAYARGFHNTSTAGVFGAVAAISVLKRLPASTVAHAFGLAGSRAAGSMQYLDNGSHNKRLHPGFACHDAFVCVALAEAGIIGATRIIEGKMGFLNAYSPDPDKDLGRLVADLGSDWTFLDTALKPYPACRMTHGLIEMAEILSQQRQKAGSKDKKALADDIKKITIRLRTANDSLVGDPLPNKIHAKCEVDGQFSAYYQTSHSYLYGSTSGVLAYDPDRLNDPILQGLCDKITVMVDDEDPELAGMGSKILVEYDDGGKEEMSRPFPLGEKEHPFTRDKVEEKFMGCFAAVFGKEKAKQMIELIDSLGAEKGESSSVKEIMALVAEIR